MAKVKKPVVVDLRVAHVEVHNGQPQFLSFGDRTVRAYPSHEYADLDPRLLFGLTPETYMAKMPLVRTAEEFEAVLNDKPMSYEGGEFLVRLTAVKKLYPHIVFSH